MKKLLKPAALLLAALMLLSVFACSGSGKDNGKDKDKTADSGKTESQDPSGSDPEPAVTPDGHDATAVPTAPPTPTASPAPTASPFPTDEPEPRYSFDPETLVYSDQYITFTLPEGQTTCSDYTAQMQAAYPYELYLMFSRSASDTTTNTVYYIMDNVDAASADFYAVMDQSQLESLLSSTFSQLIGADVAITTVRFEQINAAEYYGIIFEYTAELAGTSIRQLVWSVITDKDVGLSIAYTVPGASEMNCDLDSITVK